MVTRCESERRAWRAGEEFYEQDQENGVVRARLCVWFGFTRGRRDVPAEAGRSEVCSMSAGLGLQIYSCETIGGGKKNVRIQVLGRQVDAVGTSGVLRAAGGGVGGINGVRLTVLRVSIINASDAGIILALKQRGHQPSALERCQQTPVMGSVLL